MKAAYINQTGPPEVIIYGELPTPRPGPAQYLVKVAAVDVNPIDVYIRSGMAPAKLAFPYVLGRDLAGTIEELGPEVKRFKRGQRVWATNQGFAGRQGTFSELAVVDECWLHPIPEGVRDEEIVAVSLVGITAYLGLVNHARLKRGETVFVNGGTGGVGSSVMQVAKALGARVITTAGTDEKVAVCRKLGADLAINYKTENVDERIRASAVEGVDVWWESLREPNIERTLGFLKLRGRMIVMAGRDARSTVPIGPFYTKDCSLHGFAMFNSTAEEQEQAANDLNRWMAEGKLKAQLDRILPLSEAAEAHRLQEESTIKKTSELAGKIVLKV